MLDKIKLKVQSALREACVDKDETTTVLETLHPNGVYGALFPQLDTHYLQLKYCREHLNMLVRIIAPYEKLEISDSSMYF